MDRSTIVAPSSPDPSTDEAASASVVAFLLNSVSIRGIIVEGKEMLGEGGLAYERAPVLWPLFE